MIPVWVMASTPITIIMPFPAGGGTDLVGRVIEETLEKELQRPVTIEYKTGAAGEIGTIAVATASKDQPVLMIQTPAFVINQVLRPPKNYDLSGITPMVYLGTNVNLMVVNSNSNLSDLAKWRSTNKRLNISTGGVGSINNLHATILTQYLGNSNINVVTYKGSAPSLVAVLGNVTDACFIYVSHAQPYIDSGRIKPVAVIADSRLESMPDVPTFKELGVADLNFYSWMMVLGNQNPEIPYLQKILVRTLQTPEIQKKLQSVGLSPDVRVVTPKFLIDEKEKYQKIIKRAKIPSQN